MAKKMVLVEQPRLEELMLRDLKDREASKWKRPADEAAKTDLNAIIKDQLSNLLSTDDIKAKLYNQQLQRFLHLKSRYPEEPAAEEPESEPVRKKPKKRSTVHLMKTRSAKRKPMKKVQWEKL